MRIFTCILILSLALTLSASPIVISLEDVVSSALTRTDTAKTFKAQQTLAHSFSKLAHAPYNWNFEAEANYLDNRNENSTPFSPNLIRTTGLSLGLNKYFMSGTRFDVKLQGAKNSIGFPSGAGVIVPDYYETIGMIGISQNLLKDSFGSATRAQEQSLRLQSEKTNLQYKQNLADYSVAVMSQFYSAWLAQQKVFAAEKNLLTKKKLLQASKLKLSRGTSEKAEYLQAESAQLLAETFLTDAEEDLNRNWRELVIKMKYSDEFLNIPAKTIQLVYKPIAEDSSKLCTVDQKKLDETNQIKISKLDLKAAELNNEVTKSQSRPELSLRGSLATNGINSDLRDAQNEVNSNTNPNWFVGVVFKKSLGNDKNEAQKIESFAQLSIQQSNYSNLLDDQKVLFNKLCEDLKNISSNIEKLKTVAANQTERSRLEEGRFRLGRSTVLQVIQASDDAVSADLNFKQALVSQEIFKWRIMNINNRINDYVNQWSQAGLNE